MSIATFVPVTDGMIEHVAGHMRPEDIAEGTILHDGKHFNRSVSIRTGVQASSGLSWCILDRHGEPIAVLGAGPTPYAEVGQVWMVGTPKRTGAPFARSRRSKSSQFLRYSVI